MNTFTVNGKEYNAKPFDFNLVCDLEDMGISMEEMNSKKMSMIRAYFAISSGKDREFAGKELNAHFASGNKADSIVEAITKEMDASDFFRALNKTEEEENRTGEMAETAENNANPSE